MLVLTAFLFLIIIAAVCMLTDTGIAFNLFVFSRFFLSNPIQFGIHFLFNLTKILHFVSDIGLLLPLPLPVPSHAKSLLEYNVVLLLLLLLLYSRISSSIHLITK